MSARTQAGRAERLSRAMALFCALLVWWLGVLLPRAAPGQSNLVMSPLVSYQFEDPVGWQGQPVMSPLVAYNYHELPGDLVLRLLSSPWVSYYHPGVEGPVLALHGQVQGVGGAPVAGATVSVAWGTVPLGTAATDAGGNYALSLDPGVYALTVQAPGYSTAARVLTLSPGTARQDFDLLPLPAPPQQTPVNRPVPAFVLPPVGEFGERLKIFNGMNFVDIDTNNAPIRDLMSIVLTHGWVPPRILGGDPDHSAVESWPSNMARAMAILQVTNVATLKTQRVTDVANILAWDWSVAAQGLVPPEERVPAEGVLLGRALTNALGADYAHEVHFIGHSLGALVNAAAGNFLIGHRTAQQPVSLTPWDPKKLHFTLLDQGEVARLVGKESLQALIFDGLNLYPNSAQAVLNYVAEALQGWKPSLPSAFGWADNYISSVGFYLPRAVNVALQKGGFNPIAAHNYAFEWYYRSIVLVRHSRNPLGFKRSYEYSRLSGDDQKFPPSEKEFWPGVAYHQKSQDSDEMVLEPLPLENIFQLLVPFIGKLPDKVVQGTAGGIQFVGNVASWTLEKAEQAGEWLGKQVSRGLENASRRLSQKIEAVINWQGWSPLRLELQTGPAHAPGPLAAGPGEVWGQGQESGAQPMAWLPIEFPAGATLMAFDFTVEGDPVEDMLVCAIGTNVLFSLQAMYIPTNAFSSSSLIDVSAWSGTTNELFFGFLGGTSSGAKLVIENIRFYSLEPPRLDIASVGGTTVLSWPATAAGYVLETTASLTSPAWEIVTNAPVVAGDRYVLTNYWSDQTRFFRLRLE